MKKKQKREVPHSVSLKVEKSKTAIVLKQLLEDFTHPAEYEAPKTKCKINPAINRNDFQVLTAKIGVRLQCVYDEW